MVKHVVTEHDADDLLVKCSRRALHTQILDKRPIVVLESQDFRHRRSAEVRQSTYYSEPEKFGTRM